MIAPALHMNYMYVHAYQLEAEKKVKFEPIFPCMLCPKNLNVAQILYSGISLIQISLVQLQNLVPVT